MQCHSVKTPEKEHCVCPGKCSC